MLNPLPLGPLSAVGFMTAATFGLPGILALGALTALYSIQYYRESKGDAANQARALNMASKMVFNKIRKP